MNKYLIIFLLSLCRELLAEKYYVRRRASSTRDVHGNKIWNPLPDRFVIPPLMCSAVNISAQCTTMGGKLTVSNNGCTCECNENKSTFGFSSSWKCISNTNFHELSGCSYRLDERSSGSPIITIPRNDLQYYFLPALRSSDCNVVANKGSNLTCNGTWRKLNSNLVKSMFGVWKQKWQGDIEWFLHNYIPLNVLQGQVIRLNIECENQQTDQYCIILKVKGSLRCPLPPTPTQSTTTVSGISSTTQIRPQPSTPSSSSITIATNTTTKSDLTSRKPSTTQLRSQLPSSPPATINTKSVQTRTSPKTWSSILTDLVSSRPDRTVEQGSTARTKDSKPLTATTSSSVKNHKKSARKEKDNSGMIAGAVAGILGLVVIATGIVVMMRRRKKRKSQEQRTDTVADNPGYGRGVDNSLKFNGQESPDEDEYSYAYNNAAPIVKTHKQELGSHTNINHKPGGSVANQVYGQTDELNQMACEAPVYNTLKEAVYANVDKSKKQHPLNPADAPIHNTLEEPEYAKVDKSLKAKLSAENQEEPVYNVLEGPETDEGLSDEPPSYEVLEGSFSEGAPVYDVLEGPESADAPVYGALEEQDPHVYGALNMPDNQGPPEDNRGYDDMVYDSVGDVINDQGDIYQELNQNARRNSDVYQALNYPGNTMHLNELNQTHSSA